MSNQTTDPRTLPTRSRVVVRRKWHSPEVHAFIDHDQVGVSISVDDFVRALAAEVGSPALLMSKAGLQDKMLAAMDVVLADIKQATAHVV